MRARTSINWLSAILFVIASLAACGEKKMPYNERPVEQIYNEAMDTMQSGDYRNAAKIFDEVERQHPYSVWARRSMLMSAYCYYQYNEYQQSILAAERFISLHPGNENAVYAYYLIGISYYEQISDVGRDQDKTQKALKGLQEVVRRYPHSEYARDAQLKIDLTQDHLAGKEMAVGRYYLRRNMYLAAIGRFRNVIETYQTTSQTPEALHRLTEAYLALGVPREAQMAAAVLGHNYPASRWYRDSYRLLGGHNLAPEEDRNSWLGRVWKSVF
jgi:outer membrane protein assembly factor BamD